MCNNIRKDDYECKTYPEIIFIIIFKTTPNFGYFRNKNKIKNKNFFVVYCRCSFFVFVLWFWCHPYVRTHTKYFFHTKHKQKKHTFREKEQKENSLTGWSTLFIRAPSFHHRFCLLLHIVSLSLLLLSLDNCKLEHQQQNQHRLQLYDNKYIRHQQKDIISSFTCLIVIKF